MEQLEQTNDFSFESATLNRTVKNITSSLRTSLSKKYKKGNKETVEQILKVIGVHPDNFDALSMMSNFISGKLNNISLDANANKSEKTISALSSETSIPKDKAIGFDYLYQEMKYLYGKEEAKRLSGEMYDYSLAISDSSKLLLNYCYSVDFSRLIIEGRPFGQLPSGPCHSIRSYIGSQCETLHQLSQHNAGAIAASTLFFDLAHLCLYWHKLDIRELKTNKWFRKEIENTYQHFVHSMNMLSRDSVQCFTPEVEVLTSQGFKKYNELNIGDMVYTWKNGQMEIQPVQAVNISRYSGKMHRYAGREHVFTVTPNHRVFRKRNNLNEYELISSSEIIHTKTPVTIPVSFKEYEKEDYPISDEMLKLLTIILNDGCICHGKRNSLRIAIIKSIKRFGIELIEELLNSLEINFSVTERSHKISCADEKYQESTTRIYNLKGSKKWDINKLLNGTKKELPSFFRELSKRQAKIVLDIWSKFDGYGDFNEKTQKIKLQVDNDSIGDILQHVAMIAGYGSRKKSRTIGTNKKETKYIYIKKRENKNLNQLEEIDYEGIVWCPTTENGIVMFRDGNGNMFISGNSPFSNISINDRVKIKKVVLEMNHMFPFDKLPINEPTGLLNEEDREDFYLTYIVDYVNELQDIFLDFFDKGAPMLNGAQYRFPVSSICLSKHRNKKTCEWEPSDVKFLKSVCKREIYRYNIFTSEGTKFASCCFDGKNRVLVGKNKELVRFDKLYSSTRYTEEDIKSLGLKPDEISRGKLVIAYNDDMEIEAYVIKLDYDDVMYEITLENGTTLYSTRDHKHVVWFNEDFQLDVKSEHLYEGNEILLKKGLHSKITSLKMRYYEGPVYCLQTLTKENRFDIEGNVITHNCRLINDTELMSDYASQSNSFGAGGSVSLGSHRVLTINYPRIAYETSGEREFFKLLDSRLEDSAKILKAHKALLKRLTDAGLQMFISNGYMRLDRLFSTFGVIGIYECAELYKTKFGFDGDAMKKILQFVNSKVNEYSIKYGIAGNIEQIPGESMASRLVKVDRLLFGDVVKGNLYSNQATPLNKNVSVWERLKRDGEINSLLTGGGIAHVTMGEKVTSKIAEMLITFAIKTGCEHFALNAFYSICKLEHVMFGKNKTCPKCGESIKDYMTRIIGYFIRVSDADDIRGEEIMSRPDSFFD